MNETEIIDGINIIETACGLNIYSANIIENIYRNSLGSSNIIEIYKPLGMTCFELVEKYKKDFGLEKTKIAFSGRLDPMAHGQMLLLLNEQCSNMDYFNKKSKIYKFKILVGVQTDTFDILGLITNFSNLDNLDTNIEEFNTYISEKIQDTFQYFLNQEYQTVPPHSSFVVDTIDPITKKRQPLWWWALHNRLDEIVLPTVNKKLFDIKITDQENVDMDTLIPEIINRINLVNEKYNFRQQEIISCWQDFLNKLEKSENDKNMCIITCEAHVSSGFYIRQLVNDIGKKINIPMTTFEIERLGFF